MIRDEPLSMQIEMNCPGCQRMLRVASDHVGKQARCPLCNTIYTVPGESAQSPVSPTEKWHLKTPDGQVFGAVSRSTIESWVAEGRVNDECALLCEADGVWRKADEVFPVLRPILIAQPTQIWHAQPVFGVATLTTTPDGVVTGGRVVNAHRGALILALGIMSWALGCPIFGVLAWTMGSRDLREMQRGTMNAQGHGLTHAGQIIGMLHTLVVLIFLLLCVFGMLVAGVFR